MECLSFCVASVIDLTRLDNYLKTKLEGYSAVKSRDVLKISLAQVPQGTLYVFKNGTMVSWGLKRYQVKHYLNLIRGFIEHRFSVVVHDEVSYRIGEKIGIEPHDFFDVDCLTIDGDDDDLKLSLSYGFSQSVKLQYFETIIENLIEKYSPTIQALSRQGYMPLSRKQIRQIIGEILGAKSEMNLTSNFLYHPKYFWQHPTLEEYYTMLERYLHIQRRINALNHRLDTINEIFDMFNSYLENRHSHSLEIIIIALIAMEIILAVWNIHF